MLELQRQLHAGELQSKSQAAEIAAAKAKNDADTLALKTRIAELEASLKKAREETSAANKKNTELTAAKAAADKTIVDWEIQVIREPQTGLTSSQVSLNPVEHLYYCIQMRTTCKPKNISNFIPCLD